MHWSLRKKKKCLLIDPGINFLGNLKGFYTSRHFPFGILTIASFLQKSGCPVTILPLDNYIPEIKEYPDRRTILSNIEDILRREIRKNDYIVAGVSVTYTPQYNIACQILDLIKNIAPDIVTVTGGSHVSFTARKTLEECRALDIVVRGEGEWTMLDLLNALKNKNSLDDVKGIIYRNKQSLVRTQQRELGDLTELPVLDFGLIPFGFYKNRQMNIAASRGCHFSCKFCAERYFWGNKHRVTPVKKLAEETKILFNKYKIAFLGFEDSMIYITSDYFKRFSDYLASIKNRRLSHIVTRIDTIKNISDFALVKKAGFEVINYGLESGSEKVLKAMNKQINIENEKKVMEWTRESGIRPGAYWIIGHPGDNPHEAAISLEYMEGLYAEGLLYSSMIHRFVPYPGTDFFNNPEKYNIEIFDNNWENWRRVSRAGVCQLADFSHEEITIAMDKALKTSSQCEFLNSYRGDKQYMRSAFPLWKQH
jgi:radical SAM superfamily enzyme YgiQ (UPF0313 family)